MEGSSGPKFGDSYLCLPSNISDQFSILAWVRNKNPPRSLTQQVDSSRLRNRELGNESVLKEILASTPKLETKMTNFP